MEQEIFQVDVSYKGKTLPVEIRTDFLIPLVVKANYINPHLDVCGNPCWKLKQSDEGKGID